MITKKIYLKGYNLLSMMIAMVIFSIIFISFEKFSIRQISDKSHLFLQLQAMQIAENQLSMLASGKSCKRVVYQNNNNFNISCSDGKIEVDYKIDSFILEK